MNTRLYKLIVSIAVAPMFLTSCYEDKGNYTYGELDEVTITLPEKIAALSKSEYIEFTPTVVSRFDGEITDANPDYEFGAKINYSHRNENNETVHWLDINEEKKLSVKYFADLPAADYTLWYSVTNKKTGVTYNAEGKVSVGSTTYAGWMVLSNNGADKKCRLDIIFNDSEGKPRCAYNLLGADAPNITDGVGLHFYPSIFSTSDQFGKREAVYLLSHSGSYRLHNTTLLTQTSYNIKTLEFIYGDPSKVPGEPVAMANVYVYTTSAGGKALVTDNGDFYMINQSGAGATFEYLRNTDVVGNPATYKVAPFIGAGMGRPSGYTALLYDETNKRFMYWYVYNSEALTACEDPAENKKFSFKTGMDLVHMEGTKFSSNVVYSVLQDANRLRHVYAINMSGWGNPTQEALYTGITAPNFNEATHYAFHSQYPLMFYSYGNKVYCYNLMTQAVTDEITLDATESVTCTKFNLFQNNAANVPSLKEIEDRQYELIVCSGNGQENGGKVRFYYISEQGKASLHEEFSGFGEEVVDVTYREHP